MIRLFVLSINDYNDMMFFMFHYNLFYFFRGQTMKYIYCLIFAAGSIMFNSLIESMDQQFLYKEIARRKLAAAECYKKNEERLKPKIKALAELLSEEANETIMEQLNEILCNSKVAPLPSRTSIIQDAEQCEGLKLLVLCIDFLFSFVKHNREWISHSLPIEAEKEILTEYNRFPKPMQNLISFSDLIILIPFLREIDEATKEKRLQLLQECIMFSNEYLSPFYTTEQPQFDLA